jgi:HemK-like putative methylase
MNNPEPEAYQIGWVPFIHTKIWLDTKPLIPRTETEYWVNEVIQTILKSQILNPKSLKILDLCAGSGCIGVAVLKDVPEARVDFAELEEEHHATIRKNIQENGLNLGQTRIYGGNLFERISDQYDFILSNPPYIDPALGSRVEESVARHEPQMALYGGVGGLEVIDRILGKAADFLNPGGTLYLEHEPEQVTHLTQKPGYQGTFKDQFGRERYSAFKLPK